MPDRQHPQLWLNMQPLIVKPDKTAARNRAETRQEAKAVFPKHGSRKEDAIPFQNRQLPSNEQQPLLI